MTFVRTALCLCLTLALGACSLGEEPRFSASASRGAPPGRDVALAPALGEAAPDLAASIGSGLTLLFAPFDGATSADATEPMVGVIGLREDEYAAMQAALFVRHYGPSPQLAAGSPRDVAITVRHDLPEPTDVAPIHWLAAESAALSPGWYEVGIDPQRLPSGLVSRVLGSGQPLRARFHVGALPSVVEVRDAWDPDGSLHVRVRFSERVRFSDTLARQITVHQRGRALQCQDPDGLDLAGEDGVQMVALVCGGAGAGDLVLGLDPGIANLFDMPLVDVSGQSLRRVEVPIAPREQEAAIAPLAVALDRMSDLDAP